MADEFTQVESDLKGLKLKTQAMLAISSFTPASKVTDEKQKARIAKCDQGIGQVSQGRTATGGQRQAWLASAERTLIEARGTVA